MKSCDHRKLRRDTMRLVYLSKQERYRSALKRHMRKLRRRERALAHYAQKPSPEIRNST